MVSDGVGMGVMVGFKMTGMVEVLRKSTSRLASILAVMSVVLEGMASTVDDVWDALAVEATFFSNGNLNPPFFNFSKSSSMVGTLSGTDVLFAPSDVEALRLLSATSSFLPPPGSPIACSDSFNSSKIFLASNSS